MSILFTIATLAAGAIAIIFGVVKGIRDLRSGGLVFTEFRMAIGGMLCAASTLLAGIFTPVLLGTPEVSAVADLAPEGLPPAPEMMWWALGLAVCLVAFFVTPSPRQMVQEYAIERHGLAGMLLTQHQGAGPHKSK